MKSTLEVGVYKATATYNQGNIVNCKILDKIGIIPGQNCVDHVISVDKARIRKADKAMQEVEQKCRKQKTLENRRLEEKYEELEEPNHPSNGAGMH